MTGLMNSSRFYTPNIPSTQFDPRNWSSCRASNQSRLIFHLPLKCYGNILSVQTCLLIRKDTGGKILKLTSHVKEGDKLGKKSMDVTIRWSDEISSSCITKNESLVCCPNLIISEAAKYTDSTFISINIIMRDQIQFVRSNWMTNVTLCDDRSRSPMGPFCKHFSIFPVLTRIMIGKNHKQS